MYYNKKDNTFLYSADVQALGLPVNDPDTLAVNEIYVAQEYLPDYNDLFYYLGDKIVTISGVIAHIDYPVLEYPLDVIKKRLSSIIANKRWEHEMSGFTDSNGTYIRTDVDNRSRLLTAINACDHTSPILFKINGEFKELTCADLQAMQSAISLFVQKCFDWEDKELKRLELLNTFEELKDFTPSEFDF